jgi:GNAT superfamily N-acetyltransferase
VANSAAIVALIESVAHYFLSAPSEKGAEAFLSTISETAILGYIADPRFHYLAGYLGEELAGVAASRDNRHVYHLFVSPSHPRQELATSLWQHIQRQSIDAGYTDGFTVNSSLYAVPVYRRWGFIAVGDTQIKDGIAFQPMRRPAIV